MTKFIKRTLSLALAALLVLSLVPVMSLTADAVEYGPTWQYASGYSILNGAFKTAEEDYIYEGNEPYDWTVTLSPAGVQANVTVNAYIQNAAGQKLEVSGTVGVPKDVETTILSASNFKNLGTDAYGDFLLVVDVVYGTKVVAHLEAYFGRVAVEEPEPDPEPEVPVAPEKPGEVVWQYGKSSDGVSYDWLTGAVTTANTTGIYKGWDAYDWAITLSPTKAAATITVEANIVDHTGAAVGDPVTKDVDVSKAPAVTTILTAGDFDLSNKTLGDFRVTAVIKFNGEAIAQVQAVFGRRIGDAGYTAVEYLPGAEWANAAFSATDEDMSYVGDQAYDWAVTMSPTKMALTVDVTTTVVNEQGEVVASLPKTGVQVAKAAAVTEILNASELEALTTDLYGKFAVTCVVSMSGTNYAGVYGVFERVDGEWVAPEDTMAPVFTPADWENCGLPEAIVVTNNGDMAKKISVEININGAKLTKTVDLAVGASATLATTNQLRTVITERGKEYTVTITGYWKNAYQQVDINETLTYVWKDHTDTEVVPGYAATCTETGLTDGVYCHGCEGTIVEQEEIAINPDAHTYENGTCACGATFKFYRANESSPYGQLKLTGEVIAYVTAARKGFDSYYVVFTYDNQGDTVTVTAEPSASSDANYVLFDCAIPAPLMTADITATIYGVKDGVTYQGETIVYTIRECVDAKLNMWYASYGKNAQIAKLFDTLVNLLNYGAQAQTRFGVNTDKLATDGLPAEYAAKIKTDPVALNAYPAVDESGKAATLYNMSFKLQEKINMYGNFLVKSGFTAASDYTVKIVQTKADGSTTEYTIDNLTKSGNYLYFEFSQIAPAQMRDELQITLYKNDVAVSATYIRSGDRIVNTLPAALSALANAIMHYSDCAKAAFG